MTIRAKDTADVGFIPEWVDFILEATQPTMHDVVIKITPYIKPDPHYQECQTQYLMCLAGELLPFNPFSSSTYVSTALNEISEDFEEKAFRYAFIEKKLRYPNKSSVYRGLEKSAKILGKASIFYSVSLAGAKCIYKMSRCVAK